MSPRPEPNPAVVLLGWLLMGIGGLIAVTAGACSVIVGIPAILSALEYPEGLPNMLVMVVIFGGIPLLFGIGVFVGGRVMADRWSVKQRPPRRIEDLDDQP